MAAEFARSGDRFLDPLRQRDRFRWIGYPKLYHAEFVPAQTRDSSGTADTLSQPCGDLLQKIVADRVA